MDFSQTDGSEKVELSLILATPICALTFGRKLNLSVFVGHSFTRSKFDQT